MERGRVPDPWVILSPSRGGGSGGGMCSCEGAAPTSQHSRVTEQQGGRQVPLLTMSVIIAAQLKMDAAAASRRVRGALLSMHSRMRGWGGEPPVPDRMVQMRTLGGSRSRIPSPRTRMFKFFQFESRLQLNGD